MNEKPGQGEQEVGSGVEDVKEALDSKDRWPQQFLCSCGEGNVVGAGCFFCSF